VWKFLLQLRHAPSVVARISSKPGARMRANARAHPLRVRVCACARVRRYTSTSAKRTTVSGLCMCVGGESTALAEAHKLKRARTPHLPRPPCSPPHCRCAAALFEETLRKNVSLFFFCQRHVMAVWCVTCCLVVRRGSVCISPLVSIGLSPST
jgi:hypothetical protein